MKQLIRIGISCMLFGGFFTLLKGQEVLNAKNLAKWEPVIINFKGPQASSAGNAPNPFLDYRLDVVFTGPSGKTYKVPGFYNGDGKGNNAGNIWTVRFAPDEVGKWSFQVLFKKGDKIAVDANQKGSSVAFDGKRGKFQVDGVRKSAPGFYPLGRLQYVGKHYFKFADGGYWLKGGADSPEDLLGYVGFDNTPEATHKYEAHIRDWKPGDPDWGNGKGKAIIGALNYLASQNVNSIYFLPMNIGGDGKNVWPFLGKVHRSGKPENDNLHYDVTKLSQWDTVFTHAQRKGIFLHFVLSEAEERNKRELDNAELGVERKLYYREMIARFGYHLALQWNICEEYNLQYDLTPHRVKQFAAYIQQLDPYKHPVAVHHASKVDNIWPHFYDERLIQVASFQTRKPDNVWIWRKKSAEAGNPQVIGLDELFPDVADEKNVSRYRREYIWPIYMAGGQTELILAELLKTEDFRKYEGHWANLRHARSFFEGNLPFWEMHHMRGMMRGEDYYEGINGVCFSTVFAKPGEVYAVYFPRARQTGELDLRGISGSFTAKWYNPREGSFEGPEKRITGGDWVALGEVPSKPENDWVLLLKK